MGEVWNWGESRLHYMSGNPVDRKFLCLSKKTTVRWRRDFWFYGRILAANQFLVTNLHQVVKDGLILRLTFSRRTAFGLFDMFRLYTSAFPNKLKQQL